MLAVRSHEYDSAPALRGDSFPLTSNTHTGHATAPKPGGILAFYRNMQAQQASSNKLQTAVIGLRQNLEGGATGFALGYAKAKLGTLDIAGKYPADALGALVFYLLSVRNSDAQDGFASDLRAISQSCFTVFMARKGEEFGNGKPLFGDSDKASGKVSSDPLIAAAKAVGI